MFTPVWNGSFNFLLLAILQASFIVSSWSWLYDSWGNAGKASRQATSALYQGVRDLACLQLECCSSHWRPANTSLLEEKLFQDLVGQHIAKDLILRALRGHKNSPSPSKPLVLSLHGWTGSGKNLISKLIADSFYKRGMESKFVHLFIATLHFPNVEETSLYQDQLRAWISGNVSSCQENMFIFDEVDKIPPGVLDAVKPFLDYYDKIDGVDYRRNIFLFLSNTGGKEITETFMTNWHAGKDRDSISFNDLEPLIAAGAFNEVGGLQHSRMIEKNLVDAFVPFLPMERRHVKICVLRELERRGVHLTEDEKDSFAQKVIGELSFRPLDLQLVSVSGCKRVAQKVDFFLEEIIFEKEEL